MNTKSRPVPGASDLAALREDWRREVLAVAEALLRNGRHRRLRDVTIVLPIDHTAVEAIELACLALSQGDLAPANAELEQFFDRLLDVPVATEQFLDSVRGVARRVGSEGQGSLSFFQAK